MNARTMLRTTLAAALLYAAGGQSLYASHTLVGDPFIQGYNDWIDTWSGTPQAGNPPSWGIHLIEGTPMMENSDGRGVDGAANAGDYGPFILLQDSVTTGSAYSLSARMFTSDDDGFGLVFGYQDADNYFRVGMREQSSGSLGFTRGLAVQKVVGGVITQINPAGVGEGNLLVPTQSMIDNREPIDITVAVNGSDYSISVAGINNGDPLAMGSDDDLQAGKVGIHSWAQRTDGTPLWGTEVDSFTVNDGAGAQLFHDTFDSPIMWRPLIMTNAAGVTLPVGNDDPGNFALRFADRTIKDDSNSFEWATVEAPNVDFVGAAIVVDEPGAENFSDYEMQVRMRNQDDDGIGVLVRVQDDNTFYRVNFSNEGIGTTEQRAPRGLSVQKAVSDGMGGVIWTELFRDDQDSPLFLYTLDQPFDVSVKAIGDQLMVQVIDDPDGAANVINYPVITDSSDPLLTGTVGLANWGSGGSSAVGAFWSAYGGGAGPLLVHIPEPSSVALALLAGLGLWGLRRRSA